ncbi:MAG: hypothetical protein LBI60_02550 [Bacteroidales bacterium]|jgi:hypothetical protein|nr:hypothetical protein [Bacteroidales bacterium]
MKSKVTICSLVTFVFIGLVACVSRTTKQPKLINSLYLLYATPEEDGYLPLKIFVENDSLFVQYIKNGKPLGKIGLTYSRLEKGGYGDTIYCFDEIINGKKTGNYQIPNEVFDTKNHYGYPIIPITYKNNENNSLNVFLVKWSFSKIQNNSAVKDDTENDIFGGNEELFLRSIYSIYFNPENISSSNDISDEIWASKDGKLKIYSILYDTGGNGYGHCWQEEIVQFRDRNNVSVLGEIDWCETNIDNFPFTNDIKIYDITLNNKVFYLIDRAIVDISLRDKMHVCNGNFLQLYSIENGELIKNKLFNTGKKIVSDIVVEFDGSEFYNEHGESDKEWNLSRYDENKKIIYIPLVEGIKLTNKYLLYKWDGKYFTYTGIGKFEGK